MPPSLEVEKTWGEKKGLGDEENSSVFFQYVYNLYFVLDVFSHEVQGNSSFVWIWAFTYINLSLYVEKNVFSVKLCIIFPFLIIKF